MLILVVEDDTHIREYLEICLHDEGHEVVSAHDPKSAICLMDESVDPQVLLTDFDLGGGMDGLDLCGRMQLLHPSSRAILISGRADEATERLKAWPTPVPVLSKPFHRRQLLEILRRPN